MDKTNPLLAMISQQNAEVVNATIVKKDSSPTVIPSTPETPPPKPVVREMAESVKPKPKSGERDWERFSFVCSKEIIRKVHDISEKEGFTIRELMEFFLQRGIAEYEKKNGVAKPRNRKSIELLL